MYKVNEQGQIFATTTWETTVVSEYQGDPEQNEDHRGVAILKAGRQWFVSNFWEHSDGSRSYQYLNEAKSRSEADRIFENLVNICHRREAR